MHLLKRRSAMFYLGLVLILSMAIGGAAFGAFAAGPCSSTDAAGSTCGTSNTVASTTCSPSGGTAQTPGSDLSTAAKIWSANSTGEGMGSWTVTPTVNVAVPANTYAGTYTSNVTVDLIAGP